MPTGSGKSLCYQLPALLFDKLTVVVSPLISLMQDQVMQLHELGAPAAFLNSTLDYPTYLRTAERARTGEIKLLYTSPETLLRPETLVLLERAGVACLTIDEAHCISQWGHDFRPEYRQLLPVRQRFPAAVCAAFTATATQRVQDDIRGILGFRSEDVFVASYNRENLFLEVRSRTDGLAQVLAFLETHRGQSGIIYCSTRRQVDGLAAHLAENGWPVLPYHAGLDAATRQRNQDEFSRDRVPIIVATIAFGMGINKSNVRFVLHYNLPDSLEQYYQEIGRSGRDGLRADCLLLMSRADLVHHNQHIDEGAPSERAGRQARLQAMVRYAEAADCRRAPLLTYFGEEPAAATCGFCDNCLSAAAETPQVDVSDDARLFLRCVVNTDQTFGPGHIVKVLRGSRAAEVLRWRHDQAPEYGAGRVRSAEAWRELADEFIRQGLVTQDMGHGNLTLTEKGIAVLRGTPVLVAAQALRPTTAAEAYDTVLFEQLRTLRRKLGRSGERAPLCHLLRPLAGRDGHHLPAVAGTLPGHPRRGRAQAGAVRRCVPGRYPGLLRRARPAGTACAHGRTGPSAAANRKRRGARQPDRRSRCVIRRRPHPRRAAGAVRRDARHHRAASVALHLRRSALRPGAPSRTLRTAGRGPGARAGRAGGAWRRPVAADLRRVRGGDLRTRSCTSCGWCSVALLNAI